MQTFLVSAKHDVESYVRVIADAAGVWLSSGFVVKCNFRPKVN